MPTIKRARASIRITNLKTGLLLDANGINSFIICSLPKRFNALFLEYREMMKITVRRGIINNPHKYSIFANLNRSIPFVFYGILLNTVQRKIRLNNNNKIPANANGRNSSDFLLNSRTSIFDFSNWSISW